MSNERHLTLKLQTRGVAALLVIACLCLLAAACKEGEGVVVRHLRFEGIRAVSQSDLELALSTTGSSRLPWVAKTYFNRQEFTEDLKRIEAYYASHGYPDARVVSFKTNYTASKSEMDLTVVIDEGFATVVEAIEFEGFDALPAGHLDDVRARMSLAPGDPRDQERVEVVRALALDELRDHGYPAAAVSVAEHPGAGARHVILTYRAVPGTFATFGDVVVRGTTTVAHPLILRQMAFAKGEPFSLSALHTSQRRLYSLDLFQFATVEAGQAAAQPGRDASVPVNVTVIDGPHRKYTFGLGWGSEDHFRVQASARHLNFFGGGRTGSLEGRLSSLDRGVRAAFSDPTLGGGFALGGSGQYWYANTPAYVLHTNGGRLGLLRNLSTADPTPGGRARDSVSLTFLLEHESYTIADAALNDSSFRPTLIALGLDPTTGAGRGTLSAAMVDVQHNTVANLLDARRGSLLNLHGEIAARLSGSDFAYREVSAEARTYVPLLPSLTLAAHVRAASIGGAGDPATTVPFFKRYFLGGSTSLRGWGRFEVAPLTPAGLPIGGYSMFESSGELRLMPEGLGGFGLVAFMDAGNVGERSWRLPVSDIRADVGLGARYQTPVGPVRIDFAYQLTPNQHLSVLGRAPGDYRPWRLHFSIGQSF